MTVEAELARYVVPSRAGAAIQVLLLVDDPASGVADLVRVIGSDPAFATKVLALSNSAYYGLSGRVGTLQYAVSVLGFQTIRALAVSIAAGLDRPGAVPAGFWEQAATAATAANTVAPLMGASSPDAFCVGLLHTLGSALLHQQHPLPQLCLPSPDNLDDLEEREHQQYGISHAVAGAQVLESWHFPRRLCELIAGHHDLPLPDADPLTRALHAARTLTDLALNAEADQARGFDALRRLSEGRLTVAHIEPIVRRVKDQSAALLDGLRPS
ncbi:HDOD domain-containing protein [Jatrophihabitans telluris]|uniref:HDOD domain-containing protein n=1 Tax=Jatrophihabitans telluris TaxID=2038343 RepID=A0ABY4R2Y1_9ACTN|nr:HDOD domain-containing protein [Jatrophihabitans telluris]UQX89773.1 HDOD domain-containing protein [Jatrophihabitans telluris]